MNAEQLEGVAADLVIETCACVPVDAFLLADACGLALTPVSSTEECLVGNELRFNARARQRDQQESVARGVARWALQRAGYFASESAVARVARALLLPRSQFRSDIRKSKSVSELVRRHPNASAALIGARLGDLGALDTVAATA